jgi:serine/threonine-protein kinase
LFESQESLTPQLMAALATSGSVTRAALEACVTSPATTEKLKQDTKYAELYAPEGTPLVLVNGRGRHG